MSDSNTDPILKGNFEVKRPVKLKPGEKLSVKDELSNKAKASIGGSMVFMETNDMVWDGD